MKVLPRNDLEKQKFLSEIAKKFDKAKKYSEMEIDEIIKLCDVDDFILFRRELINFRYLARDPYKGEYWLIKTKLTEEELEKIGKNSKAIEKL